MDTEIQNLQKQLKDLQYRFAEIEGAYAKLKQQFTQIDSLYSITSSLSGIVDFEELLKFTRNVFRTRIKTSSYSLMLLDEQSERLTIKSSFGLSLESTRSDNFLSEDMIFREAISERRRVVVDNTADPGNRFKLYAGMEPETGSFLCEPLIFEGNRILGVLNLYRQRADAFTAAELEFISKISEQLAHTLNKILIYEHTKELAITDDLTGIFNRRYFNQSFEMEIQRANRYNHSLSILMLDLDNFKTYNDVNGHLMGDEVLKKVSQVLENILRKTDLVARFGGEEFIIMLPEISKDQSQRVANKLRREIEKSQFVNEETLPQGRLTISVGLSVFPDDSRDPQKLIQYADEALYDAKAKGRNCVVWHGSRDSIQKTGNSKVSKISQESANL